MAKFVFVFLVAGLLGAVAGFAGGIFAYPYIFLADQVGMDQVENRASRKVVGRGVFVHVNPSDPIHYGKGGVTVYADLLHLEPDFEVGPGPAFHVYLVPEKTVTADTEIAKTMFVDLGRLKAFKGSQNYPIPAGVDLSKYGAAVIWCEHFGVLISPAELKSQ